MCAISNEKNLQVKPYQNLSPYIHESFLQEILKP